MFVCLKTEFCAYVALALFDYFICIYLFIYYLFIYFYSQVF